MPYGFWVGESGSMNKARKDARRFFQRGEYLAGASLLLSAHISQVSIDLEKLKRGSILHGFSAMGHVVGILVWRRILNGQFNKLNHNQLDVLARGLFFKGIKFLTRPQQAYRAAEYGYNLSCEVASNARAHEKVLLQLIKIEIELYLDLVHWQDAKEEIGSALGLGFLILQEPSQVYPTFQWARILDHAARIYEIYGDVGDAPHAREWRHKAKEVREAIKHK